MTTLTVNRKKCLGLAKSHKANKNAISTIAFNFDDSKQFSFCEDCEQNISRISFYDEDRGIVYTGWEID